MDKAIEDNKKPPHANDRASGIKTVNEAVVKKKNKRPHILYKLTNTNTFYQMPIFKIEQTECYQINFL